MLPVWQGKTHEPVLSYLEIFIFQTKSENASRTALTRMILPLKMRGFSVLKKSVSTGSVLISPKGTAKQRKYLIAFGKIVRG